MTAVKKVRLDQLVVERGLASTRTQAHAAILAGEIYSGDRQLPKPGHLFDPQVPLSLRSRRSRFVSRGGVKLEGALKAFELQVQGLDFIDLGSSTGGFTDCLLQTGAASATCVDVGKAQLDYKLRQDPRVKVMESVNARTLKPEDFPKLFDLAVIDVSFISLTKVLPIAAALIKPVTGRVLALIKPQFEVGPQAIGKGGIVTDKAARQAGIQHVTDALSISGLRQLGIEPSCITGMDGNQEFFLLAERLK